MKKSAFFPVLAACLIFCGQSLGQQASHQHYLTIDSLLKNKQFFAARDLLHAKKESLSAFHLLKFAAELDNAFNQLASSNAKIDALMQQYTSQLTDTAFCHLLNIRQSNYGKLYEYQKALESMNTIIDKYSHVIPEKDLRDYKNTRIIWQNLAGQPRQEVMLKERVSIQMERDKAGLATLPVSDGADSLQFIFDTGANISTITESTASKFGMTLLDSVIDVTAITGQKIRSRIALCKDLYLRSIHLKNVVFLVFPDTALYIPQIDYQINGILGFPVISGLGEVQISRKDEFTVPIKHSTSPGQNMALDFLTPVIGIEGESYTFDTGADETLLYKPYFQKYEKNIHRKRKARDLTFGGAGGSITQKGYLVDFRARVGGKKIRLNNLMLFPEAPLEKTNHYYGNIGQDLIGKFDKMILNFREMFIRFE